MSTTEIIRDIIVNRFNRDGLTAYYFPIDRAIKTR